MSCNNGKGKKEASLLPSGLPPIFFTIEINCKKWRKKIMGGEEALDQDRSYVK